MFAKDAEMSPGEQAVLEGLLAMVEPKVSVEIGTYTGGSLWHIASRSDEVHTFDLVSHVTEKLPNVTYHLGDSAIEVPRVLSALAADGKSVDFAFVDGDHARAGVRRDTENLLNSPAMRRGVIAFHDIANEDVRAGVQDGIRGRTDLAFVDLSFVVPAATSRLLGEAWGGLGVVIVDPDRSIWPHPPEVRENAWWRTTTRRSKTWRALAPLRVAKRRALYRLRPIVRGIRGVRGARAEVSSSRPPVPPIPHAMTPKAAGRNQELVALNGGDPVQDKISQLEDQIARLESELEAERASAAALYAQLTVLSRQLDAASDPPAPGGFLGRKRRS